jgi:excisionase family DNA binding protein
MVCTPQESFLTLNEASEALRCHPSTLRQLAAAGKLGYRVGKEWGFLASQLAAYCAAQCTSTSETRLGGSRLLSTAESLDEALELTLSGRQRKRQ